MFVTVIIPRSKGHKGYGTRVGWFGLVFERDSQSYPE